MCARFITKSLDALNIRNRLCLAGWDPEMCFFLLSEVYLLFWQCVVTYFSVAALLHIWWPVRLEDQYYFFCCFGAESLLLFQAKMTFQTGRGGTTSLTQGQRTITLILSLLEIRLESSGGATLEFTETLLTVWWAVKNTGDNHNLLWGVCVINVCNVKKMERMRSRCYLEDVGALLSGSALCAVTAHLAPAMKPKRQMEKNNRHCLSPFVLFTSPLLPWCSGHHSQGN